MGASLLAVAKSIYYLWPGARFSNIRIINEPLKLLFRVYMQDRVFNSFASDKTVS